jgi:hypothetical protein
MVRIDHVRSGPMSTVLRGGCVLLVAVTAGACHVGVGPVVGYRFDDSARVGWEASGGYAVLRGAVGQAFSYGEGKGTVFYAAAEPGVLIGGTLGLDVQSDGHVGFMPGGWLGGPVAPIDDVDRKYDVLGLQPMGTLAIGYRYAHGHEIYFTPKIYLIERVSLGVH